MGKAPKNNKAAAAVTDLTKKVSEVKIDSKQEKAIVVFKKLDLKTTNSTYTFSKEMLEYLEWNETLNYLDVSGESFELYKDINNEHITKLYEYCEYLYINNIPLNGELNEYQKTYIESLSIQMVADLMAITDYLGLVKVYPIYENQFKNNLKKKTTKELRGIFDKLDKANKVIGWFDSVNKINISSWVWN